MQNQESDSRRYPECEPLRLGPVQPFEALQQPFDLHEATAILRQGFVAKADQAGHHQKTIYKHGPITVALFLFQRLARLPAHRARGVAIIQVLEGRLDVSAEGAVHDLRPGQLLVLAPGVEHNVVAHEVSVMLLMVHLMANAGGSSA